MNEATESVLTNYAIEVLNLRLEVASLRVENQKLLDEKNKEEVELEEKE